MNRVIFIICLIMASTFSNAKANSWDKVEQKAKGQTVYFYAWGGSQEINNFLRWTGQRLQSKYGITFKHVKVTDISEAISRLAAEKTAKKNSGGTIDMVWINGENFKSMKRYNLLTQPFVESLPNWQYVDQSLPVLTDFSEPTLGMEAPWGIGQLVFIYDHKKLNNPPKTHREMLNYAKTFPNKITYPRPPSFHGTSFLKSILLELSSGDEALYLPVDKSTFQQVTAPLWDYLNQLHPVSWMQGKQFPTTNAEMIQLLDDGELDLAISFNPNQIFTAQANGTLASSTKSYAMESGSLSNIHFLSIPWNATAKEGALVAINFLLSPEAQSKKGDLSVWGDPSILQSQYLKGSAKNTVLYKSVSEPHPSWQDALEKEWQKRYGH